MDYTSGPYTVTFPAEQITATFDIAIFNDPIREGNEDFMLSINSSSLPTGVSPGNLDIATVTIVDDDSKISQTSWVYINHIACIWPPSREAI